MKTRQIENDSRITCVSRKLAQTRLKNRALGHTVFLLLVLARSILDPSLTDKYVLWWPWRSLQSMV